MSASKNSAMLTGESLVGWSPPPVAEKEPLNGNSCRLEPLDAKKHAQDLFNAFEIDKSGINWTYLPYGPFESFENFRFWIEQRSIENDPLLYAVIPEPEKTALGVAGYLRITPGHGVLEIGHIHFSEQLKRTRAATESIFLLLKKAFDLGYRRCEWKCDSLNDASRRAAIRYGFQFEGIFRQHMIYKGRNRDTTWYSILDTEWAALEPAFKEWLGAENFNESGEQEVRLGELTAKALQADFSGIMFGDTFRSKKEH